MRRFVSINQKATQTSEEPDFRFGKNQASNTINTSKHCRNFLGLIARGLRLLPADKTVLVMFSLLYGKVFWIFHWLKPGPEAQTF